MLDDGEKIELEQLLAELSAADEWQKVGRRDNGLKFYEPNKMQFKAHQCTSDVILYCGGNRAGKSTLGAVELAMHCTKQYPDWYPENKRYNRPVKCVISATEFPVVARVIEPKLVDYLPRGTYKLKRSAQGYLSRVTFNDGSVIDILTSEMKDEAYESADWDLGWLDEPQQIRKYQAILRGLVDRQGRIMITFTPLTEPWMKEELVDKANGKYISVFTVNMRDNMFTRKGEPILKEEAIAKFEAAIPEDVRDTRISGQFFHLRGVVYKEFDETHIMDCDHSGGVSLCGAHYQYPDPVICVLDPHDRQPHHLIWAWIDKNNDVHVDYEHVEHLEIPLLAGKIRAIERIRRYNIRRRIIDPNFGRKPAAVGTNASVIQELAREGCSFYEANDNVELGHFIVRDYLHYDRRRPVTATNCPKLYFSREGAPRTIRSMKNLQYADWMGKTKGERDPKEGTLVDRDAHGADCIRYLLISKPNHRLLRGEGVHELHEAAY